MKKRRKRQIIKFKNKLFAEVEKKSKIPKVHSAKRVKIPKKRLTKKRYILGKKHTEKKLINKKEHDNRYRIEKAKTEIKKLEEIKQIKDSKYKKLKVIAGHSYLVHQQASNRLQSHTEKNEREVDLSKETTSKTIEYQKEAIRKVKKGTNVAKKVSENHRQTKINIRNKEIKNRMDLSSNKHKKMSNSISKATKKEQQKKMLKRQMMKRQIRKKMRAKQLAYLKEAIKGGAKVVQKIALTVAKAVSIKVILIVLLVIIALLLIVSIFATITLIQTQNTTALSTYSASENTLFELDENYSSKEINLQHYLDNIQDYEPGYDEYRVNSPEISHNVHQLLSYITANYTSKEKTPAVIRDLERIFDEHYKINYEHITEIRTKINRDGEEEQYEWKILVVTVEKKDFNNILSRRLSHDKTKTAHYELLKNTKGNYKEIFGDGLNRPSLPQTDKNGNPLVYEYKQGGLSLPAPNPNHKARKNTAVPGQCTYYVYNRLSQLGAEIKDPPMGNGGEWSFNADRKGYKVDKVAEVGKVMSMPPGVAGSSPVYGHVAIVEQVNPDGSVVVSEMNVKGPFIISYRTIKPSTAKQCYYIDFGVKP